MASNYRWISILRHTLSKLINYTPRLIGFWFGIGGGVGAGGFLVGLDCSSGD